MHVAYIVRRLPHKCLSLPRTRGRGAGWTLGALAAAYYFMFVTLETSQLLKLPLKACVPKNILR